MSSRSPSLSLRVRSVFFVIAAALALGWGAAGSLAQTRVAGERPPCVSASASARFDGVGYGHWVSVQNRCGGAVRCQVSTDVAPSPVSLALEAGQSRDLNTFLGSPASAFTATVTCTER